MHYRLPIELELTILELAAPPLAIDHLHARVRFFNKIALVHRSFTAWAQDRLRDQFLYTYRPRPDEHERLKRRFEAGYGHDRPLRRLYLDLTRLPKDIRERTDPAADSICFRISGHVCRAISKANVPSDAGGGGTCVQKQGCEAIAHFVQNDPAAVDHWEPCAMIKGYSQALDTLWVKLPYSDLNIKNLPPPRVLYIADRTVNDVWGLLEMLPSQARERCFCGTSISVRKEP